MMPTRIQNDSTAPVKAKSILARGIFKRIVDRQLLLLTMRHSLWILVLVTPAFSQSGTVQSGSYLQDTYYPLSGSNATVGPATNNFTMPATLTPTQTNSFISGLGSSAVSVRIPNGYPWQQFTVAPNSLSIQDQRTGANYMQMSPGLACDDRSMQGQLTSGSTTVTFAGGTYSLSPVDTGKTLVATGTVAGVQTAFEPTITYVNATTGTLSWPAPFSTPANTGFDLGHIDTVNFQAALNNLTVNTGGPGYVGLLPSTGGWNQGNGAICLIGAVYLAGGQSFMGQGTSQITLRGLPLQDILYQRDPSVTPAPNTFSRGGQNLSHFTLSLNANLDATQPANIIGPTGSSTPWTQVYRPIMVNSPGNANNPLGPAWMINATNGVASTAKGSAVLCVPNSLGRMPVVNQVIEFPYFTGLPIFTSTVSSLSGTGCSTGYSPATMAASLPNTTGYTATQAEWFSGTSAQNTQTSIPSGTVSYPLTVKLGNSIAPSPTFPVNMAWRGRVKIGNAAGTGYEFDYVGINPFNSTINLIDGPSTLSTALGLGSAVFPLNPCATATEFPFPVLPDINSGTPTPANAQYLPGGCVGNAAIGLPLSNGSVIQFASGSQFSNATLDDIEIGVGGENNNTAAIYEATPWNAYDSSFTNIKIYYPEYGIVQGPASTNQHGQSTAGLTGTGDHYISCSIWAGFPLVFVNMSESEISTCDTYTQLEQPSGIGAVTALTFDQTWDEQTGKTVSGVSAVTVTNWNSEPESGTGGYAPYAVLNCVVCQYHGDIFEGQGTILEGSNQHIYGGQFSDSQGDPTLNYCNGCTWDNAVAIGLGVVSSRYGQGAFMDWGPNTQAVGLVGGEYGPYLNVATGARAKVTGTTFESFFTNNLSLNSSYRSADESYIDPSEFPSGSISTQWTVDPTAPKSGAYVGCNLTTAGGGCVMQGFDGNGYLAIGPNQRFTPAPETFSMAVETPSGSNSFILQIYAVSNPFATGTCSGGRALLATVPTTTAWTVFQAPVDLTGYSNCLIQIVVGTSTVSNTQLNIGYADFQPLAQNIIAQALTIGQYGGPTVTTGSTAPSGSCVNGSLYTNASGTPNTLYVCQGAAWVGK